MKHSPGGKSAMGTPTCSATCWECRAATSACSPAREAFSEAGASCEGGSEDQSLSSYAQFELDSCARSTSGWRGFHRQPCRVLRGLTQHLPAGLCQNQQAPPEGRRRSDRRAQGWRARPATGRCVREEADVCVRKQVRGDQRAGAASRFTASHLGLKPHGLLGGRARPGVIIQLHQNLSVHLQRVCCGWVHSGKGRRGLQEVACCGQLCGALLGGRCLRIGMLLLVVVVVVPLLLLVVVVLPVTEHCDLTKTSQPCPSPVSASR